MTPPETIQAWSRMYDWLSVYDTSDVQVHQKLPPDEYGVVKLNVYLPKTMTSFGVVWQCRTNTLQDNRGSHYLRQVYGEQQIVVLLSGLYSEAARAERATPDDSYAAQREAEQAIILNTTMTKLLEIGAASGIGCVPTVREAASALDAHGLDVPARRARAALTELRKRGCIDSDGMVTEAGHKFLEDMAF